jgi:hypothetical protein
VAVLVTADPEKVTSKLRRAVEVGAEVGAYVRTRHKAREFPWVEPGTGSATVVRRASIRFRLSELLWKEILMNSSLGPPPRKAPSPSSVQGSPHVHESW